MGRWGGLGPAWGRSQPAEPLCVCRWSVMAYETKLPRPVSSSTVTEDLSEGSEVSPCACPGPSLLCLPRPPAPARNAPLQVSPLLAQGPLRWARVPWTLPRRTRSRLGLSGSSPGLGSLVTMVVSWASCPLSSRLRPAAHTLPTQAPAWAPPPYPTLPVTLC